MPPWGSAARAGYKRDERSCAPVGAPSLVAAGLTGSLGGDGGGAGHDLGPAGVAWGRCACRCGRDCRDDGHPAAFVVAGALPTFFCRRCANDHNRPCGGGFGIVLAPPR